MCVSWSCLCSVHVPRSDTDTTVRPPPHSTGVRHRQAHHPHAPRLPHARHGRGGIPLLVPGHGLRARADPRRDLLGCVFVCFVWFLWWVGVSPRLPQNHSRAHPPTNQTQQNCIVYCATHTYSSTSTHTNSAHAGAPPGPRTAPAAVAPPPPCHLRQAQPPLPSRGTLYTCICVYICGCGCIHIPKPLFATMTPPKKRAHPHIMIITEPSPTHTITTYPHRPASTTQPPNGPQSKAGRSRSASPGASRPLGGTTSMAARRWRSRYA